MAVEESPSYPTEEILKEKPFSPLIFKAFQTPQHFPSKSLNLCPNSGDLSTGAGGPLFGVALG